LTKLGTPGLIIEEEHEKLRKKEWGGFEYLFIALHEEDRWRARLRNSRARAAPRPAASPSFRAARDPLHAPLQHDQARHGLGVPARRRLSRLVLGGDDFAAVNQIAEWARALENDPEVRASPGIPAALPAPGSPEKAAADRLRELVEMRDSELITPEEYEKKRREFLEGL
jgi:hypothetical protein